LEVRKVHDQPNDHMTKPSNDPGRGEPPFHPPPNLQWLEQWQEPILEPDLPMVDAHHHFFELPPWQRYNPDDLLQDLSSGHRVLATVYLQCRERYRPDGPVALRPVGETEFVEQVARKSAADPNSTTKVCAAIVAHADLTLGSAVREVLQAHREVSPTRFRGIRHSASADHDPAFVRQSVRPPLDLLRQADFRAGFACLAEYGLSFDSWQYHPQLPDLIDLARAFPATPIVLNHVGGPAGIGGYAGRRDEIFVQWSASIRQLAACPNVVAKLGGLGMRFCGFGFEDAARPPTSEQLASAWRPYIDTCVQAFGPQRCLFESNFPVDKVSCSYPVLWNAFKRLAAGYSAADKASLFAGTANRVYRLGLA
jgi:L-fuconolactonase